MVVIATKSLIHCNYRHVFSSFVNLEIVCCFTRSVAMATKYFHNCKHYLSRVVNISPLVVTTFRSTRRVVMATRDHMSVSFVGRGLNFHRH